MPPLDSNESVDFHRGSHAEATQRAEVVLPAWIFGTGVTSTSAGRSSKPEVGHRQVLTLRAPRMLRRLRLGRVIDVQLDSWEATCASCTDLCMLWRDVKSTCCGCLCRLVHLSPGRHSHGGATRKGGCLVRPRCAVVHGPRACSRLLRRSRAGRGDNR